MRACLIAIAVTGLPATAQAQQAISQGPVRLASPISARHMAIVFITHHAPQPSHEVLPPRARASHRDYRIDPSLHAERSAHARALDEMNAINLYRPRPFRFRPVMALTFDAADIDGPARMSGIAPNLIGMAQQPH